MRRVAFALGLARVGTGVVLALSPRAARRVLDPDGLKPLTLAALRALGGRDAAIGIGVLSALATHRPARPWLLTGAAADAVDAAAFVVEGADLPPRRRRTLAATAAASAATGTVVAVTGRRRPGGVRHVEPLPMNSSG